MSNKRRFKPYDRRAQNKTMRASTRARVSRRARHTPERLRRLSESAHERPSHVVSVAKPRLTRHHVDGMAALFQEDSRRLDPQMFDRFGARLSRLGLKGPAKLPWT